MEHGGFFLGLDVLQVSVGPLSRQLIDSRAFFLLNTIDFDGPASGSGLSWTNSAAKTTTEECSQKYDGKQMILSWP